jgi:hypothetical protein
LLARGRQRAEERLGLEGEPGAHSAVVFGPRGEGLAEDSEPEEVASPLAQPGPYDRRGGFAEAADEERLELGLDAGGDVRGEGRGHARAEAVAGGPGEQAAQAALAEVDAPLMPQPGVPEGVTGEPTAGARERRGGRLAQQPGRELAGRDVGVDGLEGGGEQAREADLGVDVEDAAVMDESAGDIEREVVGPRHEVDRARGGLGGAGEEAAEGELAVGEDDLEAADPREVDRARVLAGAVDGDEGAMLPAPGEHARELVRQRGDAEAGRRHASGSSGGGGLASAADPSRRGRRLAGRRGMPRARRRRRS